MHLRIAIVVLIASLCGGVNYLSHITPVQVKPEVQNAAPTKVILTAPAQKVSIVVAVDADKHYLAWHRPVTAPLPVNQEHKRCMARVIWGEARDEVFWGQVLVGLILQARAKDNLKYFGGSDICDVAFKKKVRPDGFVMFEFDGVRTEPKTPEELAEYEGSLKLAEAILHGEFGLSDYMQNVRYFYAGNPVMFARHSLGRSWLERCTEPMTEVDGHIFSQKDKDVACYVPKRAKPQVAQFSRLASK